MEHKRKLEIDIEILENFSDATRMLFEMLVEKELTDEDSENLLVVQFLLEKCNRDLQKEIESKPGSGFDIDGLLN